MSLSTLSMAQALGIWSDLDDAYHGKNGYGGDTAEIYVYRALQDRPLLDIGEIDADTTTGRETRAAYDAANAALYDLFRLFEKAREVELWLGPRDYARKRRLGKWVAKTRETHRMHVCVRQRRDAMRAKPMGYVIREGQSRGAGRYLVRDPRNFPVIWSQSRRDAAVYDSIARVEALHAASRTDGRIVRRYGVTGGIVS